MNAVQIHHLGLGPSGPTANLALRPGESLVVVGPAASGKSLFLRCLIGGERPERGSVKLGTTTVCAGPLAGKRATPATLAKGELGSAAAAEALGACHLWDFRGEPLSALSQSQLAAAQLLPLLVADAGLIAIDGQLERLDRWTMDSVWEVLERRIQSGSALIVATNRLELVEKCDHIVVLHARQIRFAGRVKDLPGPDSETFSVETQSQVSVRALAGPFEMKVEETASGLRISSAKGQETAAALLAEGYGDVRALVTQTIDKAEKVRRLLG